MWSCGKILALSKTGGLVTGKKQKSTPLATIHPLYIILDTAQSKMRLKGSF
jgi:hypothetical protein